MRIGICLPQFGASVNSGKDVARFARTVEDLGYDSVYVGDRLITPVEPQDSYPGGEQPYPPEFTRSADPFALWAIAAASTDRVRLGSSTINAPYYNPVHLARTLTTIDVLSDGRLDVGLGLGWMHDEYAASGVPWPGRGARLDATLDLLATWWSDNPVVLDDGPVPLSPTIVDLRPVQPGGPPVYFGGASPAALARVGRRGAGWLGVELPSDYADSLWGVARTAAQDAGRDPDALRRVIRVNTTAGSTTDELLGRLDAVAASGADEAFVDPIYRWPDPDDALDAAATIIANAPRG